MENPWNPTAEELRRWAYDSHALYPVQDWDIVISADAEHDELFVQLAADDTCPKCGVFLSILYLAVGDAVSSDFGIRSKSSTVNLILLGDRYAHPAIRKWQERSRTLIEHPETFDYRRWCSGGSFLENLWPE
jgi:hypothetical protein